MTRRRVRLIGGPQHGVFIEPPYEQYARDLPQRVEVPAEKEARYVGASQRENPIPDFADRPLLVYVMAKVAHDETEIPEWCYVYAPLMEGVEDGVEKIVELDQTAMRTRSDFGGSVLEDIKSVLDQIFLTGEIQATYLPKVTLKKETTFGVDIDPSKTVNLFPLFFEGGNIIGFDPESGWVDLPEDDADDLPEELWP